MEIKGTLVDITASKRTTVHCMVWWLEHELSSEQDVVGSSRDWGNCKRDFIAITHRIKIKYWPIIERYLESIKQGLQGI